MDCLPELEGKTLGCWCKETPSSQCHGDILVKLFAERVANQVLKIGDQEKNSPPVHKS